MRTRLFSRNWLPHTTRLSLCGNRCCRKLRCFPQLLPRNVHSNFTEISTCAHTVLVPAITEDAKSKGQLTPVLLKFPPHLIVAQAIGSIDSHTTKGALCGAPGVR